MECLKDIFIANTDIHKNAYLNWRFDTEDSNEEKFYNLGDAYLEVASYLINESLKNNYGSKLDGWIFPILFDIYQGIELYLKAYKHLLNPTERIKNGGHDIWSISESIYNQINSLKQTEFKEIVEEYEIVREFIKMMYDNTSRDTTFVRYPLNKNLEDFFYIGGKEKINGLGETYTDNITIDIEKLNNWINVIHPILEKHIMFFYSNTTPKTK